MKKRMKRRMKVKVSGSWVAILEYLPMFSCSGIKEEEEEEEKVLRVPRKVYSVNAKATSSAKRRKLDDDGIVPFFSISVMLLIIRI